MARKLGLYRYGHQVKAQALRRASQGNFERVVVDLPVRTVLVAITEA